MRAVSALVLLGLLSVSSACSDPLGPQEDALRVARARWAEAEIHGYRLDLQRLCFCGGDYTSVVTIEVLDDGIVSATYQESGEPFTDSFSELYTVDDLFEEIEDAVRREAYSLEVDYDPILGYPTDIWIDYSANIADEERGYLVSGFDASE